MLALSSVADGKRSPLPIEPTAPELIFDAALLRLTKRSIGTEFGVEVFARSKVPYRGVTDLANDVVNGDVKGLARKGLRATGTDDKGTVRVGTRSVYFQGVTVNAGQTSLRARSYYFEFDTHFVFATVSATPAAAFDAVDREFLAMMSSGSASGQSGTFSGSGRPPDASTELELAIRDFDLGQYEKSVAVLERFQKNDSRAACRMGIALVEARSRPLNIPAGTELLKSAADAGDLLCMAEYGFRLYRGWGVTKNPLGGTSLIEKASDKGSSRGMAYLADLYRLGRDVSLNCKQAKSLIDASIAQDDREGWSRLGVLYYTPRCESIAPADKASIAVSSSRKGQAKGSIMATFDLGVYYHFGVGVLQNFRTAATLYKEASAHGNPLAMVNLGWLHLRGEGGLTRDPNEAIRLYSEARSMGETLGTENLGEMYVSGEYVPQDVKKGLRFLEEAVEGDDVSAMRYLGTIYGEGKHGLRQDGSLALKYFGKGCDLNDAASCLEGGAIAGRGKIIKKNPGVAVPMIEKAVQLGNVRALLWLGMFYEHGEGKPHNFQEAMRLYQLAQSKGDKEAPARIQNLIQHMRNPRGWRGTFGLPF